MATFITNTLAVTKLAYLESVFAAYFIGCYCALWLQEGHPHWHDGWSHGPVPCQSHRPGEGALTDGGKQSAAGTGAKVAVKGSGRANVTVRGCGRAKVTVRGSGRAKVTVKGSGRANVTVRVCGRAKVAVRESGRAKVTVMGCGRAIQLCRKQVRFCQKFKI